MAEPAVEEEIAAVRAGCGGAVATVRGAGVGLSGAARRGRRVFGSYSSSGGGQKASAGSGAWSQGFVGGSEGRWAWSDGMQERPSWASRVAWSRWGRGGGVGIVDRSKVGRLKEVILRGGISGG